MKIYKKQKEIKKSQRESQDGVNATTTQNEYTVRSMFSDLSKWDGFLQLYEKE